MSGRRKKAAVSRDMNNALGMEHRESEGRKEMCSTIAAGCNGVVESCICCSLTIAGPRRGCL